MYFWFGDIIQEGTREGEHTLLVQQGLRFGMILFIVSEIFFFVSFFWAFFHFALSPNIFIYCVWPPIGVTTLDPWSIPCLNTVILLSSGVTLTWAHRLILLNKEVGATHTLLTTIFLGVIFTLLQIFEYTQTTFSINDSAYGSIFFVATGFHGLHVLVGTIFLAVCYIRLRKGHFTPTRHLGFECAAWYWHFVDVVWLFLFTTIYWWGAH
jgi:heme/copper-type cytochrome/quinol oxidase subunit 3